MINEVVERRWTVSVHGNERDSETDIIIVNSIDGDPKSAKVSIADTSGSNAGRHEVIVPIDDLIELLSRVASHRKLLDR